MSIEGINLELVRKVFDLEAKVLSLETKMAEMQRQMEHNNLAVVNGLPEALPVIEYTPGGGDDDDDTLGQMDSTDPADDILAHSAQPDRHHLCVVCGKETRDKHSLCKHERRYHMAKDGNRVMCGVCRTSFPDYADLRVHLRTSHVNYH